MMVQNRPLKGLFRNCFAVSSVCLAIAEQVDFALNLCGTKRGGETRGFSASAFVLV